MDATRVTAPRILSGPGDSDVALIRLQVHGRVDGTVASAVTSVDLRFRHVGQLTGLAVRGSLSFPLPDGARVTGFASGPVHETTGDIDWSVARAVERKAAARAFHVASLETNNSQVIFA